MSKIKQDEALKLLHALEDKLNQLQSKLNETHQDLSDLKHNIIYNCNDMATPKFVKQKNNLLQCEHCGNIDDTVEYTVNPYVEDVCGEQQYENICKSCHYELCMDI